MKDQRERKGLRRRQAGKNESAQSSAAQESASSKPEPAAPSGANGSGLDPQALLDALPDPAAVVGHDGRILAVNAAWVRFGRENGLPTPGQAIGQNYLAVCDGASDAGEDTALEAARGLRAVLEGTRSEFVFEYACHSPLQQRWFQMRATPLVGSQGAAALVIHQEVTGVQQLRRSVDRGESWLREMTDNIGDVLFLVDVESSQFLYVSRAYEDIWQRPRDALAADLWSWHETLHPEDRQAAVDVFAKGLRQGDYTFQYRIVRPDGSVRWLESRGWPVHDRAGRFVRLAGVTKDITDSKATAHALEQSRRRFAGIVESAMDAILTVDATQRIVICNPAAERMFGYTAEELLGRTLDALLPADARPHHAQQVLDFGRHASDRPAARRHRAMSPDRQVMGIRKSGESFPLEVAISMDDSTGQPLYTAILRDQTERRAAQERIGHLSRMHAMLSGINLLMLKERDTSKLFESACRIAVDAGGFSMALIGLLDARGRLELTGAAGADDGLRERLERLLQTAQAEETLAAQAIREKRCIVSNDAYHDPRILFATAAPTGRVGSVAAFPLVIGNEALGAMVLYATPPHFFHSEEQKLIEQLADDIAFGIDHINKERRIHDLAYFDSVTGLANRALFLERLDRRLRSDSGDHAVFVADIQRFRNFNEALGRAAGDELLREVAGWITQHLVNADAVARIGADEFAMFVPWLADGAHSDAMVRHRIQAFHEHPFRVGGTVHRVAAAVGGALSAGVPIRAEALLRRAETALREALTRRERLVYFSDRMQESVAERLQMENALRRALDQGEFVLHFQPKRDLSSGALTGAEALIRWNNPAVGLVAPIKFVPLLEQTGLIREVGRWAVRQALETRGRWRAQLPAAPKIAVNVSAVQLRDDEFLSWLRGLAADDPSAAEGLELEITESTLMEDVGHIIAVLESVRSAGIQVSIDDFGTGFSSLSYLAKLPVDHLKIDSSFIRDMLAGPEGLSLVSTIINLAHSLRIKVIAEGVETEEQARLLRLLGCDQMQGFLLSQPLAEAEFAARFLQSPAGPPGAA